MESAGAGAGGGRGARRKSAPEGAAANRASAKEGQEASEHEQDAYTASGRRKRKDAGQQGARGQSRGWSDEEEKLFIEVKLRSTLRICLMMRPGDVLELYCMTSAKSSFPCASLPLLQIMLAACMTHTCGANRMVASLLMVACKPIAISEASFEQMLVVNAVTSAAMCMIIDRDLGLLLKHKH